MKELATLLKALSHEIRVTIMVLLSQKELCVCEIEKHLKLSQAKVSRHLTVLKHAGLVKDRREGLWIYYSVVMPKDEAHKKVLELFRGLKISKSLKVDKKNVNLCPKHRTNGDRTK